MKTEFRYFYIFNTRYTEIQGDNHFYILPCVALTITKYVKNPESGKTILFKIGWLNAIFWIGYSKRPIRKRLFPE